MTQLVSLHFPFESYKYEDVLPGEPPASPGGPGSQSQHGHAAVPEN
jgi:hypothetical protein